MRAKIASWVLPRFVIFEYRRPIWSAFNILVYVLTSICAYLILLNVCFIVCTRPRFMARACVVRSGCAQRVCALGELEAAVGAACSRRERSHRELGFCLASTPARGLCDRPVAWSTLFFIRVSYRCCRGASALVPGRESLRGFMSGSTWVAGRR